MRVFLNTIIILLMLIFQSDKYSVARKRMVNQQIVNRGISNTATINSMNKVPRHKFVPENQVPYAYEDRPLGIGYGQTISQPYIVAYMTEMLKVGSNDKVLEIGTGFGYQAAVLAEIVDQVYTVEIVEPLGIAAEKRMKELGYSNVKTKIADGYYGWEEYAPYDGIIVTAAAEFIPPPLIKQLKEGGRMIIPIGSPYYTQHLVLAEKKQGKTKTRNLLPVRFVPFTRSGE